MSLATSRGKRPVPCLDCLGVDHRQFFGSPVSALMTHLSSGLAVASAATMLLREGERLP